MADLLGMVLKEYVTPVLTAAGFTKTGPTYVLTGPRGDHVLIGFQRSDGSTAQLTKFYVNLVAIPGPAWEYTQLCYPELRSKRPREVDGLWRDRLRTDAEEVGHWFGWHPESGPRPPWQSEQWLIRDVEGVAVCGRVLTAALREEALPLLLPLLDRRQFLSQIGGENSQLSRGWLPPVTKLFLLIDEGPSDDLMREIARFEEWETKNPDRPQGLAAWARRRLAAHDGNDDE